ncbi:hypothetical protein [Bifidobacterium sp. SO4]|uniref:hypothetical protein n=1 Tax=Bifidobacterium sp. SO4 TaxID=2809030 RepID=UPI001BDCA864|nr:hypothetical protein [Bifidobacterium sp. SO4]MBT1171719.1 hypothetical protein [Bifidobacterium sp. SO4]
MSMLIGVNVTRKTLITEKVCIDWPEDRFGEPTDENVLKALRAGWVSEVDNLDLDVEEILSNESVDVFDTGDDEEER